MSTGARTADAYACNWYNCPTFKEEYLDSMCSVVKEHVSEGRLTIKHLGFTIYILKKTLYGDGGLRSLCNSYIYAQPYSSSMLFSL